MKTKLSMLLAAGCLLAAPVTSQAVVITFDGGIAYFVGGGSVVTDNTTSWQNVDYYEEDGFRLDFIGNTSNPFSAHVGDYYAAGNAVIHSHWNTGDFGEVTLVKATKIGGGTFDLNYFILTSNTDTGGADASGNEQAFVRNDGGNDIQMPSENWGFPATQIFLPNSYDGITFFEFYVNNPVDCFGMDEFYIDEPAPPPHGVPDAGSSALLLALGVGALGAFRRR